jgi:hypothetical protein
MDNLAWSLFKKEITSNEKRKKNNLKKNEIKIEIKNLS